jgi:hypothetical protein
MELNEVWAPEVSLNEVISQGVLLEKSIPASIDDKKSKRLCKLYYIRSKDVFVTVVDEFRIEEDIVPTQVVTDKERIIQFRKKYLNQDAVESKDNFGEFEQSLSYNVYETDFIVSEVDKIKEVGFLLEVNPKTNEETYYIDEIDAFIQVPANGDVPYKFESLELRKKYSIPFKDERMHGLF